MNTNKITRRIDRNTRSISEFEDGRVLVTLPAHYVTVTPRSIDRMSATISITNKNEAHELYDMLREYIDNE